MERLNITLAPEYGAKLEAMAERLHVQPGTLARSLLSTAIDEAEPDPRNLTELLESIPGAYEAVQRGRQAARDGGTISLDELVAREPD